MPLKINWKQVAKKFKYAAMDESGTIAFFECSPKKLSPEKRNGLWVKSEGLVSVFGNFPFSALLEPYHPRDWETSLTVRPHEWDYQAMAERRQFGMFGMTGDIPLYGHLDRYSPKDEEGLFFRRVEGGYWYTTFTPMTEPRPLEEEE